MAPLFGPSILPKAPELGSPSSPKRILVPAKVAESMLVTTPPAQVITACPKPKRSTRKANVICNPSPQAMVRQRMRLRSVENSHAASKTARIPNTPVNRPKATPPKNVDFTLTKVSYPNSYRPYNAPYRRADRGSGYNFQFHVWISVRSRLQCGCRTGPRSQPW